MDILVVEDDPLHRGYLCDAIRAALPECTNIVEAADGKFGEKLARESRCEYIVMDLQMSGRNGVEAARTIWKERPETSILFWSNYGDEAYVRGISRIVPNGAAYGYILKSASDERLRLALRSVFIEGQCVIDRELRGLQQKSLGKINGFSDSEYEILLDIALGLTDRLIAKRHNLSLRSVQNRLQQLYDKLGLYQTDEQDSEESRYNLRCRAVTVAFLRKLLNYSALEKAEAEFSEWQRDKGSLRSID
jgi:DNA-binding NarL/FixJ family response regulator